MQQGTVPEAGRCLRLSDVDAIPALTQEHSVSGEQGLWTISVRTPLADLCAPGRGLDLSRLNPLTRKMEQEQFLPAFIAPTGSS